MDGLNRSGEDGAPNTALTLRTNLPVDATAQRKRVGPIRDIQFVGVVARPTVLLARKRVSFGLGHLQQVLSIFMSFNPLFSLRSVLGVDRSQICGLWLLRVRQKDGVAPPILL